MSPSLSSSRETGSKQHDGFNDLSEYVAGLKDALTFDKGPFLLPFHLDAESSSNAGGPTVDFIFQAFINKQNGDKQKYVEPVACTAVGQEHIAVFARLEMEQIEERKRNGQENSSDAVYLDPNTKTSLAAVCKEVAPAFEWDLFKYRDFCGRLKEWIEAAKDAEYDLIDDSSCGDEEDPTSYESSVCSSITEDSRS